MHKTWSVMVSILSMLALVIIPLTQPAAAAADTWGDYSLMFSRSAGQFYSNGTVAGQWAWTPISTVTSDISWGDPAAWPPKYAERFV